MTMIRAVGAEFNTVLELDAYGGYYLPNPNTTQKRGGAYSFQCPDDASFGEMHAWIAVNFLASAENFVQVCYWPGGAPTAVQTIIQLRSGATVIAYLRYNTDGRIQAYVGASLVGTSTNSITSQAWNVIEMRLKMNDDPGTGKFTVRLNGNVEVDYTGDTKPGSDTTFNTVVMGNGGAEATGAAYYDDIVVNDTNIVSELNPNNSWPNGVKLVLLKPTGAGYYTEMTPSTGNNWDCVDNLPPSIATYVTATVDGKRDTYVMENCPAGMGPIAAVMPTWWGQISGTPACSHIKRLMRSGGVDQASANIDVPNIFSKFREILELSPFTNLPWTVSEIDGLEAGQQSAT